MEEKILRHDKEEVLNALEYLYLANRDPEYQAQYNIITDYIEDTVNLVTKYKEIAEKANRTTQMLNAIVKSVPQDHKPPLFKRDHRK